MKITRDQTDKIVDLFRRAGKAADAVRDAAAKVEANANTIERGARPGRRSLRTMAAAAWADLLGRVFQ